MTKQTVRVGDVRFKIKRTALIFCPGIGLSSEAFKQAGFNVIGGIDISAEAMANYMLNFPDAKYLCKSLREVDVKTICEYFGIEPGEIDTIQISNPCTETSTTGTQELFAATNDLYFVGARLALALKPKVIVFENVEGLTRPQMEMLLCMLTAVLKKEGSEYNMEARVLNSHLYGDPQSRNRIYINMTRKSVGQPAWPSQVPQEDRKVIRDILPGAEYVVNTNFGERLYYANEPLPTIVAHPNMQIFSEDGFKRMSPRELARGMGLSDTFQLLGSQAQQELGIGNGVCIGVMRSIAESVMDQLNNLPPENPSTHLSLLPPVEEEHNVIETQYAQSEAA